MAARTKAMAFSVALRAAWVHPRIVLADVDHLEAERIEAAFRYGPTEGLFMQQRRAGCHHDTVEPVFDDVLADQFLPRVRAHVLVLTGNHHPRQARRVLRHRLDVHRGGDVRPAMTDVHADAHMTVSSFHGFHLRYAACSNFSHRASAATMLRWSPSSWAEKPNAKPSSCVK